MTVVRLVVGDVWSSVVGAARHNSSVHGGVMTEKPWLMTERMGVTHGFGVLF